MVLKMQSSREAHLQWRRTRSLQETKRSRLNNAKSIVLGKFHVMNMAY